MKNYFIANTKSFFNARNNFGIALVLAVKNESDFAHAIVCFG
jgi:hypothetical protein